MIPQERRAIVVKLLADEPNLSLLDIDQIVLRLHQLCPMGRRCVCQHGRYWEQGPDDDSSTPVYIDALPPDDPRRIEYEQTIGRRIE